MRGSHLGVEVGGGERGEAGAAAEGGLRRRGGGGGLRDPGADAPEAERPSVRCIVDGLSTTVEIN